MDRYTKMLKINFITLILFAGTVVQISGQCENYTVKSVSGAATDSTYIIVSKGQPLNYSVSAINGEVESVISSEKQFTSATGLVMAKCTSGRCLSLVVPWVDLGLCCVKAKSDVKD